MDIHVIGLSLSPRTVALAFVALVALGVVLLTVAAHLQEARYRKERHEARTAALRAQAASRPPVLRGGSDRAALSGLRTDHGRLASGSGGFSTPARKGFAAYGKQRFPDDQAS